MSVTFSAPPLFPLLVSRARKHFRVNTKWAAYGHVNNCVRLYFSRLLARPPASARNLNLAG